MKTEHKEKQSFSECSQLCEHDKTYKELGTEYLKLSINNHKEWLNFLNQKWRPVSVCEQRENEYKQKVKEAIKQEQERIKHYINSEYWLHQEGKHIEVTKLLHFINSQSSPEKQNNGLLTLFDKEMKK